MLNLLFHSSEAIVGGSPYNRTQAELDAFCDRLERFFAFATQELGAAPATFAEFRHAHTSALMRDPPRHAAPAAGPGGQRAAAVPARGTGRTSAATTVEYVAHPPRAGGSARTGAARSPGFRAERGAILDRALRLGLDRSRRWRIRRRARAR